MSPPRSLLPSKFGSSNLTRSHANQNVNQEGTTHITSHVGTSFRSPTSRVPQPSSGAENRILYPSAVGSLVSPDVDDEGKRSRTPSSLPRAPSFPSPRTISPYLHPYAPPQPERQHVTTGNISGNPEAPRTSNSPTPGCFSSAPAGHSASNHLLDVTPGQLSSRHDPYNFASSSSSASTLTYDSFWSSRSFRGSSGNVLANAAVADGSPSYIVDLHTLGSNGPESNDSSTNKVGGKRKNGKSGNVEDRGMTAIEE